MKELEKELLFKLEPSALSQMYKASRSIFEPGLLSETQWEFRLMRKEGVNAVEKTERTEGVDVLKREAFETTHLDELNGQRIQLLVSD